MLTYSGCVTCTQWLWYSHLVIVVPIVVVVFTYSDCGFHTQWVVLTHSGYVLIHSGYGDHPLYGDAGSPNSRALWWLCSLWGSAGDNFMASSASLASHLQANALNYSWALDLMH